MLTAKPIPFYARVVALMAAYLSDTHDAEPIPRKRYIRQDVRRNYTKKQRLRKRAELLARVRKQS